MKHIRTAALLLVFMIVLATVPAAAAEIDVTPGADAEAEKNYLDALNIYRQLASANQEVYEPDVANTLLCVALMQANTSNFNEAKKNMTAALNIYERLEKRNPGLYTDQINDIKELFEELKNEM